MSMLTIPSFIYIDCYLSYWLLKFTSYIETQDTEYSMCVSINDQMCVVGSERLKEMSVRIPQKVAVAHGVINNSIYVLGKVLSGLLRNNGNTEHPDVPYQDSKLTKYMINSLGNKCMWLC